ncbi:MULTISPECIES: RagB/SusD family nutrient uptake outer membrane protein [Sphingobacterium]|uniref:RagB/SusD family nutrient uptake outer membrane protein n=1 Tax=Sphingobacterium athyrii TaxID=2152717 RepID=A0A363NLD8_9SPHI|nr:MULTISPECIES: RagB/SusD family nutrient uptake outer membrane protein [Sphingobacterium]PUV21636.1 RagB/SusD family nutrient uptake outer membrane protein [Sphingobacterium athyrii]QIH35814.1 RagB/SusD family nutrient uptake outer membrane protein [Sphingobacterium sp. DR205]
MKKIIYFGMIMTASALTSCNKYLDIQPVGTVIPTSESDFRGLMTSSYTSFPAHKSYLSLRTDELLLDESSTDAARTKDIYLWNDQNPDPATTAYPYLAFYKSIFYSNQIISTIDEKLSSNATVDQIKGEAYLMRAYAHFELLNLYSEVYSASNVGLRGVPLSTKIDLEQRFVPATIGDSYALVLSDMEKGTALLTVDDQAKGANYRFSKRVAYAMASRLHLYRGEWKAAMEGAQKALAINDKLVDLNAVASLLPNDFESVEVIMALEKVSIPEVRSSSFISPSLLSAYSDGDLRKGRYFQKRGADYVSLKGGENRFNVSFRNADLYLTIAECNARLGNTAEALKYLSALKKNRFTADAYSKETKADAGLSKDQLLDAVLLERKRELALEGLRWYDLKRTTRPTITHSSFGRTMTLQQNDPRYVIRYPQEAINNNPDLLK